MKNIFGEKFKGAFISFRRKAFVVKAAFVCFFGISFSFIFESVLDGFIARPLHVLPSFTGGEVLSETIDAIGDCDENGAAFDLISYRVHKPVTNAKWQQSAEYWQLDLDFAAGPAFVRNTTIYIGADNIGGASDVPLEPEEKIIFDKERPWNFAVKISGAEGRGRIYDSDKNYICDTEILALDDGSKLQVRLPLRDKRLQKVLGSKKTWHYVMAGNYSDMRDALGENAALEVAMTDGQVDKAKKEEEERNFVAQVKKIYEESAAQESSTFDDTEKALAFYAQKLEEDPADYVNMAYYGSWLATKGGESSAMKAMSLVNQAYKYLDKAAELSRGKAGELDVLMNRASVSAAVPEQIFGKSEVGAEDFMRAAGLSDDKNLKAYCYAMAYECFKKCEKDTKAAIALQEAKKMLR